MKTDIINAMFSMFHAEQQGATILDGRTHGSKESAYGPIRCSTEQSETEKERRLREAEEKRQRKLAKRATVKK